MLEVTYIEELLSDLLKNVGRNYQKILSPPGIIL